MIKLTHVLPWHQAVSVCQAQRHSYALITLIASSGSTPRDRGKMVVTVDAQSDSIGGGQLEHLVIEQARELLRSGQAAQQQTKYPLAAAANQCCGGSVTVLTETFFPAPHNVVIFGAGHVGRRVAHLLSDLDTHTEVIDSRAEWLNDVDADVCTLTDSPVAACAELAANSYVLVMTHDHVLDYDIIKHLLNRADLSFVGLIGSTTKWQNFQRRLRRDGFSDATLARVRCPIGLTEVPGKTPMAVAISIVGEYLNLTQVVSVDAEHTHAVN